MAKPNKGNIPSDERLKALMEEILTSGEVRSHGQMLKALKTRDVTISQATVSRKFKEFGIRDVDGVYRSCQLSEAEQELRRLLDDHALFGARELKFFGMNVGFGWTEAVARKIDTAFSGSILGTLTGPQFVLVVAPDDERGASALERLGGMLPPEKLQDFTGEEKELPETEKADSH